jgi:hypothetical protein
MIRDNLLQRDMTTSQISLVITCNYVFSWHMNTDIVRKSVPKSEFVTKLHGMFSDDIVS